MKGLITITSNIDAKTFQRFAYFDAYRFKKHHRAPLSFAAIMLSFSAFCFLVLGDRPQAALIGTVLLAIGVLLPMVYFLVFTFSVRAQAKKLKLPRAAYSLTMTTAPEGLEIVGEDGKERVKLAWKKVYGAYRVRGCTYLYVHPTKAFLLPDGQANKTPDELFAFLQKRLGENCTQDCRLIKR